MPTVYGRDLDLNLLRVFAVVAECGSVTEAASRLYLTQPAVSASLRRLTAAVGAPLFVRSGRGLALSSRGDRLRRSLEPHLQKIVDAALEPPTFDPRTCARTIKLGLADSAEEWLLPRLLRVLEREAPDIRVAVVPVQFRTVAAALASGVEIAITVADELPTTIRREPLLKSGFVCLYDPRHCKIGKLTEKVYFAHEHVVVSYNGDLRGFVEDLFGKTRNVRCSVPSFAHVGALIEGTARLATIPELVANPICALRPRLRTKPAPFTADGTGAELLWPNATDDDDACRFVRDKVKAIAAELSAAARPPRRRSSRGARAARRTGSR